MSFNKWYEDADMPTKGEDGKWYDAETGIPYQSQQKSNARNAISERAKASRAVAKGFGGKALAGTSKQKEWAETIRSQKLAAMSDEAAQLICDPRGLCTQSKFWIENKEKSGNEFEQFIVRQKYLLNLSKKIRAEATLEKFKGGAIPIQRKEEYAKTVLEYNALTAAWGL